MHAISSGVLVGFVAAALVACGNTEKNPEAGGGTTGNAEAGAAGANHGGSGPGGDEQGGAGGTATVGGAGEVGMDGGSGGTPSAGGMSTTGAGAGANGIGGDASSGGASTGDASSGGASTGGASTGGASTGGTSTMSGTGGANMIEPPPNCESERQSADGETCSYEYTCDGRSHFDSCRRDDDGVWACECGTFSTAKRYFELEGVEGLEACSVIARICEGEDAPVSPTRTCRTNEPSIDSGSCSAQAICASALELDLGPGIVARTVERYRSECKTNEYSIFADGAFDCSCASDSTAIDTYLVTAPSIDDVCEPLVNFCTTPEPLVFADRICGYSEPSGTVEQTCPNDPDCQGCMLYQECGRTAPIATDVSIVSMNAEDTGYRYIVCRPEEGDLHCTCERMNEGVYSDETVSSELLDMCRESIAVCPP